MSTNDWFWSEAEVELLKSCSGPAEYQEKALQHGFRYRGYGAVCTKRRVLGLARPSNVFTPEELSIIEEYYAEFGANAVRGILRYAGYERNVNSISRRASSMGIVRDYRKDARRDRWSEEEIEILIEFFPFNPLEVTQAKLREAGYERTDNAISIKARNIGLEIGESYYD